MKKALSFADVLLVPTFSDIVSRRDVSLEVDFMGEKLTLPVLSAPMDTVTNAKLAIELHNAGGLACLHRFQSIGDNVKEFEDVLKATGRSPIVSVGLQDSERLEALVKSGSNKVLLDIAHGSQQSTIDWINETYKKYSNINLMVGNFATKEQVWKVEVHIENRDHNTVWRLGIGSGSGCTTRVKTGCGLPTFASIYDFTYKNDYKVDNNFPIVADGGIKTPGDVAKALAAGASVVMLGGMLAGTDESPGSLFQELGEVKDLQQALKYGPVFKKFRGSASTSSYRDQGKEWSCAEGEEFLIPYKGSVVEVLKEIDGGLRSALTYCGSKDLTYFKNNVTFVEISNNGYVEGTSHGKKV